MTDREAQQDELTAIESIYPDILQYTSKSQIVRLAFTHDVQLLITLPSTYPSSDPPTFELSGPILSAQQRMELMNALNETYIDNIGMPILFSWISTVKEYLEANFTQNNAEEDALCALNDSGFSSQNVEPDEDLNIFHGEVFTDRKSHFQAHLCKIYSKVEAAKVLAELKKNNKIARATHNIYAYRICTTSSAGQEIRINDCEDDGETGASSKMLELMDKMGAENVIVVVSRWYGGIHLGPDRFRHINNLTREIIAQHGLDHRVNK